MGSVRFVAPESSGGNRLVAYAGGPGSHTGFRWIWGVAFFLVMLRAAMPAGAESQPHEKSDFAPPSQSLNGMQGDSSSSDSYTYRPAGRRDPFASLFQMRAREQERSDLPPLQRYALSDLTVTGILWSEDGYRAMIRTPDGKAYVVQPGAILGTNRGIVEDIGEEALTVEEHVTDIYGRTQEHERILRLRPAEGES